MSDWIERYHGSHPQKGWAIVGGGEEIVYLGESVSSEQVSKIVAAHNARVHDLSADNAIAPDAAPSPSASSVPVTPAATWREKGEPDPHGKQYECERAALTLGKLTDDELANGVFMNADRRLDIDRVMARDPDYYPPIVWLTAAKERIRWLSRALLQANGATK